MLVLKMQADDSRYAALFELQSMIVIHPNTQRQVHIQISSSPDIDNHLRR